MTNPEESNFLQEIELEFDSQLIQDNTEVMNSLAETYPHDLKRFYLDSDNQIQAYFYRLLPRDSERIYTIPTDADYVVLSPYGATIFQLFNKTNPEDISSTKEYNHSSLTETGLGTITRYLIINSKNESIISPGIKQENDLEEVFQVVGVNLPNLVELCHSGHLYLSYLSEKDIRARERMNKKQRQLQKKLNRHI